MRTPKTPFIKGKKNTYFAEIAYCIYANKQYIAADFAMPKTQDINKTIEEVFTFPSTHKMSDELLEKYIEKHKDDDFEFAILQYALLDGYKGTFTESQINRLIDVTNSDYAASFIKRKELTKEQRARLFNNPVPSKHIIGDKIGCFPMSAGEYIKCCEKDIPQSIIETIIREHQDQIGSPQLQFIPYQCIHFDKPDTFDFLSLEGIKELGVDERALGYAQFYEAIIQNRSSPLQTKLTALPQCENLAKINATSSRIADTVAMALLTAIISMRISKEAEKEYTEAIKANLPHTSEEMKLKMTKKILSANYAHFLLPRIAETAKSDETLALLAAVYEKANYYCATSKYAGEKTLKALTLINPQKNLYFLVRFWGKATEPMSKEWFSDDFKNPNIQYIIATSNATPADILDGLKSKGIQEIDDLLMLRDEGNYDMDLGNTKTELLKSVVQYMLLKEYNTYHFKETINQDVIYTKEGVRAAKHFFEKAKDMALKSDTIKKALTQFENEYITEYERRKRFIENEPTMFIKTTKDGKQTYCFDIKALDDPAAMEELQKIIKKETNLGTLYDMKQYMLAAFETMDIMHPLALPRYYCYMYRITPFMEDIDKKMAQITKRDKEHIHTQKEVNIEIEDR